MKTPSNNFPTRRAAMAAMLLLLATASGCGVGMPTQPAIDPTPASSREVVSTTTMDLDPLLIDEGSGSNNSGAGMSGPPTVPGQQNTVVLPMPGPGNSDWGHSHKPKRR